MTQAKSSRQLNHYSVFSFTDFFWQQPSKQQQAFLKQLSQQIPQLAEQVFLYHIFPTRSEGDLMIWSAVQVNDPLRPASFFTQFSSTNRLLETVSQATHHPVGIHASFPLLDGEVLSGIGSVGARTQTLSCPLSLYQNLRMVFDEQGDSTANDERAHQSGPPIS